MGWPKRAPGPPVNSRRHSDYCEGPQPGVRGTACMKKSCKNGTAASRFSNGKLSGSQFPSSFTGPALMAESRSLEVRRSSSLISPIESSQDDIARRTCEAGGCASQGVRALTALACSAAPRVARQARPTRSLRHEDVLARLRPVGTVAMKDFFERLIDTANAKVALQ